MSPKFLLGTILLLSLTAVGQKTNHKTAAKYGSAITADYLKKHLYIIAGDEMEGRGTATEGERKAAAYIENHFRTVGLQPVKDNRFRQVFHVYQDKFDGAELMVNGVAAVADKDFGAILGQNRSAELYFSEFAFVNKSIVSDSKNDYDKIDVTGRLVLINGIDRDDSYQFKLRRAMSKGAAAILLIQDKVSSFVPMQNQETGISMELYKRTASPNIFTITPEVAASMFDTTSAAVLSGGLENGIYSADVKLLFKKATHALETSNVLGMVEGADKKDEYVIITAHYDHIGIVNGKINPGADDDGSGTVALLALSESFAKAKAAGKGPRRSIIFMAVSGEEKGLWGSAHYADHPVINLENTVVNLNIDMIGRVGDPYKAHKDSTNYLFIIGDDRLSSDLRPVSEFANKNSVKLKLDYRYNGNDPNMFYFRSDHYNFAKKGVPAIFYFNGVHEDYHQPTDTPDKINYDLYEKRVQLIYHTAWEMANRADKVKRDLKLEMPNRRM